MRVAGYVREAPGRGQSDPAFAQSEQIRRWALDTGNDLIAVCQDTHQAADPTVRPGLRALLELVRTGQADAVVVATLDALSPDKVIQEIMLVDIREGGATVIATDERDLEILRDGGVDHTRLIVRDVVAQLAEYRSAFGLSRDVEPTPTAPAEAAKDGDDGDGRDVVVELIAPRG